MNAVWPRLRPVFLAAACMAAITAGAYAQPEPTTTPAVKEGWWIRINPTNQAGHVYWRFGTSPTTLGVPVTWAQGVSPAEVDAPPEHRTIERVHVALLGMPPPAPVSVCLFFRDRGVALIEFNQERNMDVDVSQSAPQCVP